MKKTYLIIGILAVIVIAALAYFNRSPNSANLTIPEINPNGSSNELSFSMQISSPAFPNNGAIPSKYTCDALSPISPPLSIADIPSSTASLALIVDDPDVPRQVLPAGVFDHWIAFNIPPTTTDIAEGTSPGVQGVNSANKPGYTPPCPPPQYQPAEHRYVFTLYALDTTLNPPPNATKQEVLAAMEGHVVGLAQLTGRYQRASNAK